MLHQPDFKDSLPFLPAEVSVLDLNFSAYGFLIADIGVRHEESFDAFVKPFQMLLRHLSLGHLFEGL